MRPHKLEVTAFGPFADKVEVDFDEVAAAGSLVLIHGQTGGGKTTLLDAMCFALYGDTSGGERAVREMKSHHAPQDAYTEVGFEFSVRRQRYRVERKFKIGGVTYKSRVRLDAFDEASGTFRTLSTKATEVAGQIEGILGLNKDQFRQVIVLPQGRFRDFLNARSKEREEILASLFDTERFESVARALKAAASEVQGRLGRALERRELVLDQTGHADLAGMRREADELARAAATQEAQLNLLSAARDARSVELSDARALELRFAELERARARVAALEERAAEHHALRERVTAARSAERLAPAAQAAERAEREGAEAATRAEAVRADRDRAAQLLVEARERAEREAERAEARAGLLDRAGALERARTDVAAAAAAEAELASAQASARAAAADAEARAEAARRADKRAAECEAEHARSAAAAARLDALSSGLREAEQRLAQAERRAELEEALAARARLKAEAARRVEAAEAEHQRAARASRAAEAGWVAGLSAELASRLEDGEPCPVCGSEDHPTPAHLSAAVTRETLEKARAAEERARRALEEARLAASQHVAEEGRLRGALEETPAVDGESARADRESRAADLRAAQEDAEKLEERAAGLEAARADRAQRRAASEVAMRQAASAASAVEVAEAVCAERRARLPEGSPAPDALEREIEHLRTRARTLDEARAAAVDEARAAEARASQLEGQRVEVEAAAARAQEEAASTRAALQAALEGAGFSLATFEAAQADVPRLDALVAAAEAWRAELEAERGRAAAAAAAVDGRARPEVGPLEAALEAANAEVGAAHEALATLRARARRVAESVESLEATEAEVARFRARDDVVGRLARVASGDHPGRITFQRFVLGALLDDVLRTASARLGQMTRGRYQLKRGSEAGRRRGGLDLAVLDAYTGTERPVQTLSGGESFLAALALALGLADAVQARAGGLQLEAIFVDEGFGGLDPEALDLAMDALGRLKDAGRLVGIISHVEELKERVEARVEVLPSRVGSAVRLAV